MKEKFRCTNEACAKDHPDGVTLEQESIMDEQNLAQMFCPRCKSRLVRDQDAARAAS